VPNGRSLMLPLPNTVFGAGVGDCLTPLPFNPGPCDVPTLRAAAAAYIDSVNIQALEVILDGTQVLDLSAYRAKSPVFSYSLTTDNLLAFLGFPDAAGTYSPVISDGYWLIFTPLSPGKHTIVSTGAAFGGDSIIHPTVAQ